MVRIRVQVGVVCKIKLLWKHKETFVIELMSILWVLCFMVREFLDLVWDFFDGRQVYGAIVSVTMGERLVGTRLQCHCGTVSTTAADVLFAEL
ncbi:hypothetical protein BD779DRAFT_403660 [Infundibulicybe gibba]|nr:hypothetical protein BD779DRAFT_403660 [Infundibulicybe gibba]